MKKIKKKYSIVSFNNIDPSARKRYYLMRTTIHVRKKYLFFGEPVEEIYDEDFVDMRTTNTLEALNSNSRKSFGTKEMALEYPEFYSARSVEDIEEYFESLKCVEDTEIIKDLDIV
jgi:hypothetical protein